MTHHETVPDLNPSEIRIVTVANEGIVKAEFASNWLRSLEKVGLAGQAKVYTREAKTRVLLKRKGIPVGTWKDPTLPEVNSWAHYGSVEFKWATLAKISLLKSLIAESDRPILFADADIAVLRDPLPELIGLSQFQPLAFQADDRMGVKDPATLICTSFLLLQAKLWSGWGNLLDLGQKDVPSFRHDQELLQERIVQNKEIPDALLPQIRFPNGSCLEGGGGIPPEALMMHFNFMVGRTKLIQMRRHGVWYVRDGMCEYLKARISPDKETISQWRISMGKFRGKFGK